LQHLLVGERPVLGAVILDLASAGREAALAELVGVRIRATVSSFVENLVLARERVDCPNAALVATSRARVSSSASAPQPSSPPDAAGRIRAGRGQPLARASIL